MRLLGLADVGDKGMWRSWCGNQERYGANREQRDRQVKTVMVEPLNVELTASQPGGNSAEENLE
jgi:hypothetical protein